MSRTKKLGIACAVLAVFIFLLNIFAMQRSWYFFVWWFDMPMHFLGGMWIGLMSAWMYFLGPFKKDSRVMSVAQVVCVALLSVFVVGVLWEGYEYFVQISIPGATVGNLFDSISDLFFDMAGASASAIYLISHISFVKEGESTI